MLGPAMAIAAFRREAYGASLLWTDRAVRPAPTLVAQHRPALAAVLASDCPLSVAQSESLPVGVQSLTRSVDVLRMGGEHAAERRVVSGNHGDPQCFRLVAPPGDVVGRGHALTLPVSPRCRHSHTCHRTDERAISPTISAAATPIGTEVSSRRFDGRWQK